MAATKEQKHVDPPPTLAVHAAVAELVWSGALDGVFAVVKQSAHARFLSEQCRLVGVPIETDSAFAKSTNGGGGGAFADAVASNGDDAGESASLRLRLEEIYVGLCHGFLELQRPGSGSEHSSNPLDVDAFCDELKAAVRRGDDPAAVDSQPSRPQQQQLQLTPLQKLRLRVFRDLWARGYFVAFGSKFSADFLIYESAPSPSCHATALVLVRAFDAPFASVDVVSHCRVAKMVKKQLFFASQLRGSAEILYVAVNHALLATRQEM